MGVLILLIWKDRRSSIIARPHTCSTCSLKLSPWIVSWWPCHEHCTSDGSTQIRSEDRGKWRLPHPKVIPTATDVFRIHYFRISNLPSCLKSRCSWLIPNYLKIHTVQQTLSASASMATEGPRSPEIGTTNSSYSWAHDRMQRQSFVRDTATSIVITGI